MHTSAFFFYFRRLLGVIISKYGIMVDPLKVEAMVWFPPSYTIFHIQSIQGKENVFWYFIANYAKVTKGFMSLLRKRVPFVWYDDAKHSFDELKWDIMPTLLLHPLYYSIYFLFYMVAYESTICMVLV